MTNTNCIYCSKTYTTRGINKHIKYCKIKQSKLEEPIKSNLEHVKSEVYLNYDCCRLIYEFLAGTDFLNPLENTVRDFIHLSQVSKIFYDTLDWKLLINCGSLSKLKQRIEKESVIGITKTDAKNLYKLNDNDLSLLSFTNKKNPYYRSSPPMCIYLKRDVIKKAKEKYLCVENLNRRKEKTIERVIQIREKRLSSATRRRDELVTELAKYNLKLRSDSRLCDDYIMDGIGNAPHIAQIMNEMKFYFDKTTYKNEYRLIRNSNQYFCRLPEEISDDAKQEALRKWVKNTVDPLNCLFLPESLKKNVENIIFEVQTSPCHLIPSEPFKSCANVPSKVCGYCRNCCTIKNCTKHKH